MESRTLSQFRPRTPSKVTADGEDAKAADALLKLAKVQNWTSGEEYKDRPVYANLTQADIDRLRAEVDAKQEQEKAGQTQRAEKAAKLN
jgi:hypothetical protein